ncbi:unnamed protein product [Phytomonas sp. EM1]|nr:unnamed protein product [Phytomonas sp. EM1]|eukprot:CCW61468.1 unnamed protein product [Phytomonas sp. isolate EM1]
MFCVIISIFRWIWQEMLLPNVILGMAALVTDGVEAWREMGQTLYVLFFFFRGKSHRKFPLSKNLLAACREKPIEKQCRSRKTSNNVSKGFSTGGGTSGAPFDKTDFLTTEYDSHSSCNTNMRGTCICDRTEAICDSADINNDTSQTNALHEVQLLTSDNVERKPKPLVAACKDIDPSTASKRGSRAVSIQRRILLGKKGEQQVCLGEVIGSILVPFDFPLNYSKTLHTLVSCVIGPIQQPSVSTLPTRHPAPQWPPHYVRNNTATNSSISKGGLIPAVSSSEYSDRRLEVQGDTNSSAADGFTSSSAWGSQQPFRQASNVVYRRVSARKLDFRPSRAFPAHPIASITAHHVLSYQATRQKVLVMDLDETLCYVSTSTANMIGPPTFSEVIPTASGAELFHVWVRPYARIFLTTMAKLFNIALFTSASKSYADTILSRIDPDHIVKERYYRQDCRIFPRGAFAKTLRERRHVATATCSAFGRNSSDNNTHPPSAVGDRPSILSAATGFTDEASYTDKGSLDHSLRPSFNENSKVLIKDLRVLKVPSELLVLIDNSEECTLLNRDNALIIMPYIPSMDLQKAPRKVIKDCSDNCATSSGIVGGNGMVGCGDPEEDEVLLSLITFLEALLVVPDVRSVLRHGKVF